MASHPIVRVISFDPEDERRRESLFSLGNGFLLLRSALPWAPASKLFYKGTYAAGCYNELSSQINEQTVWDETLVNLPDPHAISIQFNGEDPLWLQPEQLIRYEQDLDLRQAIMRRTMVMRDLKQRETRICEERFVSMTAPDLVALQISFTPINWSGEININAAIDGNVINGNIEKHADLSNRHLQILRVNADADRSFLEAETTNSRSQIKIASVDVAREGKNAGGMCASGSQIVLRSILPAQSGKTVTFERLTSICVRDLTSSAITGDPVTHCSSSARSYGAFRHEHTAAWRELWQEMQFEAQDEDVDRATQLTLFHLLQNYSFNSIGRDVGFPARGWQEVYRGQIFWDEMFVLPVLNLRFPSLAREILMYRYRRLDQARQNAEAKGLSGALFPWRSAHEGTEATPRFQKFMKSGNWHEDHTDLQVHVNASIAWDILHYVWTTGDGEFLAGPGIEMLVEIARLWASLATYDAEEDRFDINGVVGPDEFHTHCRDKEQPGLPNNAYTNMMAVWTLVQVLDVLNDAASHDRLGVHVGDEELARWDHISRRMRIAFTRAGLVSQFDGVDILPPLDPEQFGESNAQWELEAAGLDVNDYQLFKQADFAVLLYLFDLNELRLLLDRLGYSIDADVLRGSFEHYRRLTTHHSSLSEISYAAGLSLFDQQASFETWQKALAPDLNPAHAGGTAEGLHFGAMAASLDVLQRRYLGLLFGPAGLALEPRIPKQLGATSFTFRFRDGRFRLDWSGRNLTLSASAQNPDALVFRSGEALRCLSPGASVTVLGNDG